MKRKNNLKENKTHIIRKNNEIFNTLPDKIHLIFYIGHEQ